MALSASAQEYQSKQIGIIQENGSYILSYPLTTISVELLVESEVVTPGIYARYAQKYLSMRAPLIAQTNYRIVDASINALDGLLVNDMQAAPSIREYSSLPVDQYSSEVLATENAARDAATAIFTIRRQRRDIINGEAGEGYFGAGLSNAIEALDKMEQEYIELFMGTRTISQSIKTYTFTPTKDLQRFVIARFDTKDGVLPSTDLIGAPIYIQFTPQTLPNTSAIEATKNSATNINIRVAAPTQCALYNDYQIVTSTVLPIYEFGKTIQIENPKR